MNRDVVSLVAGLSLTLLPVPAAAQQPQIEPSSPHWGDSVVVTARPPDLDKADRLFVRIGLYRHGVLSSSEGPWTTMTWDGAQFVARVTLPNGCETGYARVATMERSIGSVRPFVCRTADGDLPPGALIEGLIWGGRDRANWQADVTADLAALSKQPDHGWEYSVLWLFRRSADRTAFTRDVFLRDVQRVDRDEKSRTAGLLSSLVYGYDGAGETALAFDRLKELCDRFPESELTGRLGLYFASIAVVNHPEFEPELNRLLAQVALRSPDNPGLRTLMSRLVARTPTPIATIRQIAEGWMRDEPENMQPHYYLAEALAQSQAADAQSEAESHASAAIDLVFRPHPFDSAERRPRQAVFELRSKLRTARGDLAGASADAQIARTIAEAGFGRPAPTFSATTLDAKTIDTASLRGRITVLDFWFINCPPCAVERPKLNAIVDEFGDRVRFVGFALDSPEALTAYRKANPYRYEIVARSQAIADAFDVKSFPTHMVIDASGTIVWLSGSDDDRIERLRATIARVLAAARQ